MTKDLLYVPFAGNIASREKLLCSSNKHFKKEDCDVLIILHLILEPIVFYYHKLFIKHQIFIRLTDFSAILEFHKLYLLYSSPDFSISFSSFII